MDQDGRVATDVIGFKGEVNTCMDEKSDNIGRALMAEPRMAVKARGKGSFISETRLLKNRILHTLLGKPLANQRHKWDPELSGLLVLSSHPLLIITLNWF